MFWYQDPNMLSAIGSLSAVLISLVALYLSYRGQSAQQLREKREELRGVLERLVSLREEQNAFVTKEQDEGVIVNTLSYQNTKREMYLETAESLAREISSYVSAAEYYVLGLENSQDSDFVQAEAYYKMAVKRSKDSSPIAQSHFLQSLASIYFIPDPALRNIDEGRTNYERAAQVLEKRDDEYSYFIRGVVCRNWGASEMDVNNLPKAGELFESTYVEWMKLRTSFDVSWTTELRTLAYNWGSLGVAYFQRREDNASYVEMGRLAFLKAQKVIEALSNTYGGENDYTREARGLVFQWWGEQEYMANFSPEGQQLLAQAEQEFQRLSDSFAWKNIRLAGLKQAGSQIARGEVQAKLLPEEVPQDATNQPERLPGMIHADETNTKSLKP